MKFVEPTKFHRKSGVWGTRPFFEGRRVKFAEPHQASQEIGVPLLIGRL